MDDPETLAQRYLDALESGDASAVAALFTPAGVVVSPLYGTRPAKDFYAALFADTARSETTFIRTLVARAPDAAFALQFAYRWTLASGEVVSFEVVDVVEVEPDGRFSKLTILYDTAPLRAQHAAGRKS